MTIKTAVEIVKLCLEDNKNFNVIDALKTITKFANDADKYRWHDLRENPADLPNEAGEYLVFAPLYEQISADCFDDTPKYSVQPFCMMANGMHWLGDVCDDEVWLWKEIEPFEGGNEDDK